METEFPHETATFSDADGRFTGTLPSDEDSDLHYGIAIGYNFSENFAIEGGYRDLGEFGRDGAFSATLTRGPTINGILAETFEVTGLFAGLVGTLPLTRDFSLYVKGGLLQYELEESCTVSAEGITVTVVDGCAGSDDSELYYAVGAKWEINDIVEIGVEALFFEIEDEWEDGNHLGVSVIYNL